MSQQCTDPIVGKILAGWRYDISGLALEMRGDYEGHFAGCEFCRSRQRMHRIIDVGLIASGLGFRRRFSAGLWSGAALRSAARFLAGDCGAGGLCAFGADLVGGGRSDAGACHRAGCGEARRAPGARPPATGDPGTPAGRAPHEDHGDLVVIKPAITDPIGISTISRIVIAVLLCTMAAAVVEGACLLPAAASHSMLPSSMAGCHHSKVPSPSRPADYRCCISRHPSALVAKVFSPRPEIQLVEAVAIPLFVASKGQYRSCCCTRPFLHPSRLSDS